MTTSTVATIPAHLIGKPITGYTDDRGVKVVVTLWHRHADISTWAGHNCTRRLDNWSGPVPHADAHREATRILAVFNAHNTCADIEARCEKLRRDLRDQDNRPYGSRDKALIEQTETELGWLEDLETRRVRERVAQFLNAA